MNNTNQTNSKLIYWDSINRKLVGSVDAKIKKYFELDLIKKVADNIFLIYPIPGYNITTYKIVNGVCSCQGFKMYDNCSHKKAVLLFQEFAK